MDLGSARMNLLVTGGAGFIGSNLVHHLLSNPPSEGVDCLVNLDALSYAGNRDNLAGLEAETRHVFVHGTIHDETLVMSLLEKHRIDAVLHLAAETHVDRSIDSPELFAETNVIGTLRLLQACRHYWSKLNETEKNQFRFVYVSTDEVFGSLAPSDPPFSESTPYQPRSPYAASKAASDHFVRACGNTYGLPIILTNCSNNYGPRQFPEKLIPLVILNALEGRPLPVYGDGQQRRDWLFVADHCRALDLVLQSGRVGETYNIGGESETANFDLVQLLCGILDRVAPRRDGQSYQAQIAHVADRPGHDRRYAMSIQKIKNELGWHPSETLQSGLEKTVRWYLDNRAWSQAITEKKYARERLGQL
jgi:dTDP-glucose 4,6-dehydratase